MKQMTQSKAEYLVVHYLMGIHNTEALVTKLELAGLIEIIPDPTLLDIVKDIRREHHADRENNQSVYINSGQYDALMAALKREVACES